MPLYMDIHTVDSDDFSAEDVVKAHMEDLAIQDQFGVKQLKYWVNEQAKTIFCLMEGPDKDACNQVHVQSHGNTACNIIEVSDNEYNLFMGQGTDVGDLATTDYGSLDPGYRTILLTNFVDFSEQQKPYIKDIKQLIKQHNGAMVREPNNQIMVTFMYATDALACGSNMLQLFSNQDSLAYNLAIVSGKPVDEEGTSFFEETKAKINSLCSLGLNNNPFLDKETLILSEKEQRPQNAILERFNWVNNDDFTFCLTLYQVIATNYIKSEFNSEALFAMIGMSKSQASRKIKSLLGLTPNQLIQESRLQIAIDLLGQESKTIAEIAYDSGFNSPTYFTRIFKKRFGIPPSDFLKQLA